MNISYIYNIFNNVLVYFYTLLTLAAVKCNLVKFMLHMYLNSNTVLKNNHSLHINTIKLFSSPFLKNICCS